jgi:hypothetical protein
MYKNSIRGTRRGEVFGEIITVYSNNHAKHTATPTVCKMQVLMFTTSDEYTYQCALKC